MRILFSLFLICFLTIGVLAQDGECSIEGTITDLQGVVKGAIVTLTDESSKNVKYSSETNDEGKYCFHAAPMKYTLTASKVENGKIIATGSTNIEINFGKKPPVVNLILSENDSIREEVTVNISSGVAQPIEEVSKTVDIISNREIRGRNEFSLTDSLRTIPGFRVQQLGGFGRITTIKSRGLRNQDTAILIDGIRFRDASAITGDASAFLSDFTFAGDNRVEVLRGSGSSLYGTNAIGGTIDFQTPKPASGFHGGLTGEGGGLGFERVRGNISDGTKSGKFAFNLGVGRTVFSEGIDGDDGARNTNFQSRVEYNPFSKTNVSARFYVSDASVKLNSSPDTIGILPATNATIIRAVPLSRDLLRRIENGQAVTNFGGANFIPDANDPDNIQKSQFFDGQIVLTQIINSKLVFQSYYQGLRTQRKNVNGVLGVGFQPFGGDETSIFTGLIHTLNNHFNYSPNANNLITFGYEYERERFGNNGFTTNVADSFTTRAHQTSNTIYAQDQLGFFKRKLQISGGFRAQFFNLKNPTFTGTNSPYNNLSLENPPTAYTFDGSASYFFERTKTKIRTHVGNGYRVPSLFERFGSFFATFLVPNRFVPFGAPDLKPERSIGFDGGVDQIFYKNRVKLSAVYFYTRLIDTIGFGKLAQPDRFGRDNNLSGGGYFNTKGGISRGAEFSGQIRATDSTDVFASYTYVNSDQRAPQASGSGILQTLGIPKNQITLVATQRIGKRFSVNFDFLATSDYLAPIFDSNNFTFQNYVYRFRGNRRGDLTARYEFPTFSEKLRFIAFGTIENLFDYDYFENGFRTTGRTARAGFGLNF